LATGGESRKIAMSADVLVGWPDAQFAIAEGGPPKPAPA
jgi:hypothetical protein